MDNSEINHDQAQNQNQGLPIKGTISQEYRETQTSVKLELDMETGHVYEVQEFSKDRYDVIEPVESIDSTEPTKKKVLKKKAPKKDKLITTSTTKDIKNSKDIEEKSPRVIRYYSIDISNIPSYVNSMTRFMAIHPEFFKTNVSKKLIYINENQIYNVYTDPVVFKDTIHNIKGNIVTGYDSTKKEYTMIINIKTTSKSSEINPCYAKEVEKYVANQLKHGDYVELYYNKILNDTIIKHCYYSQPMSQWIKDVEILKDEFFLPGKDYLLAIMNNKIDNNNIGSTTSSWNNLILSGPYGCGKSTYIYRVSMMLKMPILSVDLSLYLNKKKELYALLHGQEFLLPNGTEKQPAMTNVIIALEEFDNAIERLLDIENIFKYKDVLKRNYLNVKNKELKEKAAMFAKVDDSEEVIEIKDENGNIINKSASTTKGVDESGKPITIDDADEFMAQLMLEDGFDIKNNKVLDKARMEVLSMRSHDNELHGINAELNNIIKSMDDDNKSNILRMHDLLELFSPSVPIQGRIIIGTTNHLEKMKSKIPALFRAGRLTTIELTYLDWISLNQLTHYYFQRSMTLEPFEIIIPTSEVVELAIKHKLTDNAFDDFETELSMRCNNK